MPHQLDGSESPRRIGVIGRLGLHPLTRLSVPTRRVFAYLAVQSAPVERARVAAALWPDQIDEAARSNLRRAIWQAPPGWVVGEGGELLLDAQVDLAAVRETAGRALAGEAMSFAEIEALSVDLLPGWHEEWLLAIQDGYHLLRVQALEAACRTLVRLGRFALATQAGNAALAAEPLNESAAEALITAHLAQRNRYKAVQCFKALASRLDRELGVAPDPALAAQVGLQTGLGAGSREAPPR